MRTKRLTLQQKREIFLALVHTQDARTMSVPESKRVVMQNFQISDDQLEKIVEEGVDKEWPPLNESVAQAS